MKIEILNSTSFYYLIMNQDSEFRQIPFISEFGNCMNDYSEMCGCGGGEAKAHKLKQCEMMYRNIILSHLDEIKNQLLEQNEEIEFRSFEPEEKFLGTIKRLE